MPIIFKYVKVPRPDGTLRAAPFIPIKARDANGKYLEIVALLDSGADQAVIPKDLADILGLNLKNTKTETGGIGGRVDVKETRLNFMIEGNRERYVLDVPALVLQDKDSDVPLLLGRHGFFEHFHIIFKQDKEKIILKKISPKVTY